MIVFDDIIFTMQNKGGGSTYWRSLTEGIEKAGVDRVVRVGINVRSLGNNEVKQLSLLERFKDPLSEFSYSEEVVFHSSYYRISKKKGVKNVVTIHDFIPEKKLSVVRAISNYIVKFRCILHSSMIVCVSDATRKDLIRFFPWISTKKIVVIHNWISKEFIYKALPRENYYLFVGARRSYKGFEKALRHVDASLLKRLVVVGGYFNHVEEDMIKSFPDVKIDLLTGVSNNDLSELYNRAFALLHPSDYEGFGLTIIEAFACGCPVIGQKCPAVEEITFHWDLLYQKPSSEEFLAKDQLLRDNYDFYSKRAIEISFNYQEQRQLQEYIKMYQTLCSI